MKKFFLFSLVIAVFFSFIPTSFAFWGNDFPDNQVKRIIKREVFYFTEEYSNWGKTSNVTNIKIVQKYQTSEQGLKNIMEKKYHWRGPDWIIGVINEVHVVNTNLPNPNEKILFVIYDANFIVKEKKHRVVGMIAIAKKVNKKRWWCLSNIGCAWKNKGEKFSTDIELDNYLTNLLPLIK